MFWGGVFVPAAILVLVAINLASHRVYWLNMREGPIVAYTTFWPILGIILMKAGLAGALCCWYLLSNLKQTERYAPILKWAFGAVAGAGLAIFVAWLFPASFMY